MKRRSFLRTTATASVVASAGCVSAFADGPDDVVLPPQEDQMGTSEAISYPAYGQRFPEFTLPNPLTGEKVGSRTTDAVTVATAIYATCPNECLVLGNQLAGVQHMLAERGYTDGVRFLAVTFDPERDTAPVLRDYAERMGIDLGAGNWYFLRPEDATEAEAVVTDELGIGFEREGSTFIHPSVTFLVNPDGYVERAYNGERPKRDRVTGDAETVAEEYGV
jgi:protein SCO1/2